MHVVLQAAVFFQDEKMIQTLSSILGGRLAEVAASSVPSQSKTEYVTQVWAVFLLSDILHSVNTHARCHHYNVLQCWNTPETQEHINLRCKTSLAQ
jgi:hypothetical protein